MLSVLDPGEALAVIRENFAPLSGVETVELSAAPGRILAADAVPADFVPGFDRSTVDGYAIRAADSFGCSEAIPALFRLSRSIAMGEMSGATLSSGCCAYVPTGAAVPTGADAVAMLEYCEDLGDGTIALSRAVAPGENLLFRGEDLSPGRALLRAGHRIGSRDIGSLAAMGLYRPEVLRRPVVGIISTGDELVDAASPLSGARVRDSNSPMLAACVEEFGAGSRIYGIVRDEPELLAAALDRALSDCDCVLISGGSSVGARDHAASVIAARGEVLFHGISVKPGKPTILGRCGRKPVFGLPGHPAAAWFICRVFVRAAVEALCGSQTRPITLPAILTESVSANHGRAQYTGVELFRDSGRWYARPIRSKSGLISSLCRADGFFCTPRDREGAAAGEEVDVCLYSTCQEVQAP